MSDVSAGGALGALEATSATQNPLLLMGFNSYRAQNTILKGGFLDNKSGRGPFAKSRAKYRPFVGNSLNPLGPQGANQFVGGTNIFGRSTRRGQRMAAGGRRCS